MLRSSRRANPRAFPQQGSSLAARVVRLDPIEAALSTERDCIAHRQVVGPFETSLTVESNAALLAESCDRCPTDEAGYGTHDFSAVSFHALKTRKATP
jgi:hypothetical protein